MDTYRPNEFARLIAKTTKTLQRWDREGILKAHRTPTNRRFYTHDQLSEILGVKVDLMAIIHCFSCRLYGLRRYKKIIKEAVSDNSDSL